MVDRDVGFEAWYRESHPRLVSSLLVIAGGDRSLAADAADEGFARAYAQWGRVSQMTSPSGWTYRTAVNVLRRRHRRTRLERTVLRRHHSPSTEDAARPGDWSVEMWDVLRGLPTRERTAIALRYVADLPTDAIAYAMSIAPGTVGSTLHAARARLARLLAESNDPPTAPGSTSEEEPSHA